METRDSPAADPGKGTPDEERERLGEPTKDPSSDPDWRSDPFWDPQWRPEEPPRGGFWDGVAFAVLWLIGALGGAAGVLVTILLVLVWVGSTAVVLTAMLNPGRSVANFELLTVVTALSWILVYRRFRKAGSRRAGGGES